MKNILGAFIFISLSLLFYSCNTSKSTMTNEVEKVSADYFEGTVKYKFIIGNVRGLSDAELDEKLSKTETMFGRHMTYFLKDANLKTTIDGSFVKMTTYNDGSDSMWVHMPDENILKRVSTYDDWNFTYDTIEIVKNAKTVYNIECDLLKFISEKYTWKYYYSDKYKLNPEHYKHIQSTFMNKAIEETGALPLRVEGKIPGSSIYMEAEFITEEKLPNSVFAIPKI